MLWWPCTWAACHLASGTVRLGTGQATTVGGCAQTLGVEKGGAFIGMRHGREEGMMHLLGQTVLGVVILLLLGVLVIIKQIATGSVLDKPQGSFLIQLVSVFNLFFLLIVNPVAAVTLLAGSLAHLDPTHFTSRRRGS